MQKRRYSSLSLILSIVLVSLFTLLITGCQEKESPNVANDNQIKEAIQLGEGQTHFYLTVVDPEQKETYFEIHTDKTTVGEALKEQNLISGEEGPYGLNIKTVHQITLDYQKDKMYWAFYIDGNYAPTGVDSTDIVANSQYSLKAERA